MYGFISIENTVKIFGAEGRHWAWGEGRNRDALLSHLSQVLLAAWRLPRRPIHSSDPLCRGEGHNRSPLFHYCHRPTSPSRRRNAGVHGATECRPTPRDLLARCLWCFPSSLYSSSNCILSEPVKGVTSCGSRSCEWGPTPPLVSGHWWSPPAFRGTPPSAPETHERCRSRSPTGSPRAVRNTHTQFN